MKVYSSLVKEKTLTRMTKMFRRQEATTKATFQKDKKESIPKLLSWWKKERPFFHCLSGIDGFIFFFSFYSSFQLKSGFLFCSFSKVVYMALVLRGYMSLFTPTSISEPKLRIHAARAKEVLGQEKVCKSLVPVR